MIKTADGLFLNLEKATEVIVSFKEENLNLIIADDMNNTDAFVFVTAYNNGQAIINDLNYGNSAKISYSDIFSGNQFGKGYLTRTQKTYTFLGKYENYYKTFDRECQDGIKKGCSVISKSCDENGENCKYTKTIYDNNRSILKRGDCTQDFSSCRWTENYFNGHSTTCYWADENGQNAQQGCYANYVTEEGFAVQLEGCNKNGYNCNKVSTIYGGKLNGIQLKNCDNKFKCTGCVVRTTDNCHLYEKTDENGEIYYEYPKG